MKSALFAILALSALSVAFGVTTTYYTDNACATMAANPIAGTPNPTVAPLTACTKSYTSGTPAATYYVKYIACAGALSGGTVYTDAACTLGPQVMAEAVGTCINAASFGIPGVGSYKLACSSAATATLAFISVAAAALALCI
jgi:hypothetical protein